MGKGVTEFEEIWRKTSKKFKIVVQLPCAEALKGWDISFEEEKAEEGYD